MKKLLNRETVRILSKDLVEQLHGQTNKSERCVEQITTAFAATRTYQVPMYWQCLQIDVACTDTKQFYTRIQPTKVKTYEAYSKQFFGCTNVGVAVDMIE